MSEVISFLERWFEAHADGEWEHDEGITIESLDNPGWYLTISLLGTELEGVTRAKRAIDDGSPDWVHCWSDGCQFVVAAGPLGLTRALAEFRAFASGQAIAD